MLLVEDDLVSVSALSGILRRKGYDVMVAHTVQAGLRQLADSPDWVLLDLMLPDGDGAQLLRHIRMQRLPIKVVVITAVNDAAHLHQVRELRPQLLLKKPLDVASLLRTFELQH